MLSGDSDPIGTILLVDDDKDLREFLYMHLLHCGHSVLQAGSGYEAIERFQHNSQDIDILVTDIVMPDLSGDQLALRLCKEKPGLPVLFISGNSPAHLHPALPLHEGINFLRKPFSIETLEKAIANLLPTEAHN
jgi:DNA-binding NtrC family response regulator